MKIDFVVAWVDGSDPAWQERKAKAKKEVLGIEEKKLNDNSARYRDWDTFKFWFRSVEKNAPWVNRVYLVTDHQIPEFLDIKSPKLKIVFHDEFIPKEYLPTFSANTIETNFFRLPELSEYFVYFNDDMYINKPLKPSDFFRKGKPCYELIERPFAFTTPTTFMEHLCYNDIGVVNKHFTRKDVKKHLFKFVNIRYGKSGLKNLKYLKSGKIHHFQDNHMACPFLKSTFKEVWEKEFEICDKTCKNKFRENSDVNQYVFKYWDLARGNFAPYHFIGGYYCVNGENVNACALDITKGTHKLICVNDNDNITEEEFFKYKDVIVSAFNTRYKENSEFEK